MAKSAADNCSRTGLSLRRTRTAPSLPEENEYNDARTADVDEKAVVIGGHNI